MADLVSNAELVGFPGAPYADAVLKAAAESVRSECGWHIAPPVTDTLELTSTGQIVLLPSLRVSSVTAVRNADTSEVLEGWRLDKRAGVLTRSVALWPRRVEVDLVHGFDTCPDDLFPTIADRARAFAAGGHVRQESLGSRSVSMTPLDNAVARYALPPRP